MANLEDEAKDKLNNLNNKAHELKGRIEQAADDANKDQQKHTWGEEEDW